MAQRLEERVAQIVESRVERVFGEAVGIYEVDTGEKVKPYPNGARQVINGWHLPDKDNKKWLPLLRGAKSPGIPHIAMGYSLYEMLRAAEYLARKEGINVSASDKKINFKYFGQILQRAGYHFPNARKSMEDLAEEVDALSKYDSKVAELTDRTFRLSRNDHPAKVTLETYEGFLRPNSRKVFKQIAQEYNFKGYKKIKQVK